MSALARNLDIKGIGKGTDDSLVNGDLPGLIVRINMSAKNSSNIIDYPFIDNSGSTITMLFRRLKDQFYLTGK